MELIYHTADVRKDLPSIVRLFDSDIETIELDFVLSKDGIPIWTHDVFPTTFQKSTSNNLKDSLKLYEILDINNKKHKLMLDMKYIPRQFLYSDTFNKLLQHLNNYDSSGGIQIQTLDLALLEKIANGIYPNIETGLIINCLSKGFINGLHIPRIPSIKFMAISSELWERNKGAYINKCNQLYPDAEKYAWTWDVETRPETDERINNFLDKGASKIITGNPEKTKKLVMEWQSKRG